MISSRGFTGTGLKKCMPTTRSGRVVNPPSIVMGMVEVFEAKMTSGGHRASSSPSSFCFTSIFSKTASITASALAASARAVLRVNRASTSSGASDTTPLAWSLPSESCMSASALSSASARVSIRVTS